MNSKTAQRHYISLHAEQRLNTRTTTKDKQKGTREMTNEMINENFLKCIEWVRERVNTIGANPLYIGWGNEDYTHPFNDRDFQGREYSLRIDRDDLSVDVLTSGAYYMQTYGYTKEEIEKFENGYKRIGMKCPCNKHTFDELSIQAKEKFLKEWPRIKKVILDRVMEVKRLDDFKV